MKLIQIECDIFAQLFDNKTKPATVAGLEFGKSAHERNISHLAVMLTCIDLQRYFKKGV